ncbi:MAG: hypothetical protein ACTSPI_00525 [Candidatus Heimdallarchaeaceae archaeon]
MNEYQNLEKQIKECEDRIIKILDSIQSLLVKAIQLEIYINKCHLRMTEIQGESNG